MVWVKGQSGNPSGRVRATKDIIALAKEMSAEAMSILRRTMRQDKDPKLAFQAAIAILDRAFGKPKTAVEVDSHKNETVTIEVSDTEAARKIAFALAKGVEAKDETTIQ